MSLIQKPPLWLWRALGILTGVSPQKLDGRVTPVVDAMQGGIGLATWFSERTAVPLNTAFSITTGPPGAKDDGLARIVRWSSTNQAGAVAGVNVFAKMNQVQGGGADLTVDISNVAIATTVWWWDMSVGSQWLYIPPGFQLILSGTSAAGAGMIIDRHWAEIPAGAKGW